ncbi:MAG TPA: hypothetical protein VK191_16140 [Symbiobacteriaceae bacterium]|nr:hypothetical protein [Symbiobacteriaceae bacterium]
MSDLLVISPGGRRKRPDLGPLPAAERYDGPHHRLVMNGVSTLRSAGLQVEVQFLSPKWGLVEEGEPLFDYDLALAALGRAAATAHLAALRLPEALATAIARAPLAVLLLPGKYLSPLRALAGGAGSAARATTGPLGFLQPPSGGRLLAFVAPSEHLTGPQVTTIHCDPALTGPFHAPNTALKGRLFQALAGGIALDPDPALAALRSDPTPQTAWRLIDQGR